MGKETILLVDDEVEILDLLEVYLVNDGYSVLKCTRGAQALDEVKGREIHLAILDVMLPDMDGFRLLKEIREEFFFPIIMLTAKIADGDKIMGLTMGADDYITKPFNPLEVVARVKTQLRRYQSYNQPKDAPGEGEEYDIRGLVINRLSHKCLLYGREISLTPIEFSILWHLAEHQGRVVPSDELFEAVWGEKYYRNNNNTVMAHIGRLREKLQEPAKNPKFIKTVWGVGYEIE
ncbi:MAG: VanR-ABDEGLN family response regulator transcription factor [Tissierellia bacterium]|nr:VanR-ABDEGLN family response regulator transcription factor [Tissierellia bacterium]